MRFCQASPVTRELLSPALATRSQRPETSSSAPSRLHLSFPVFQSALMLLAVNLTTASREWVYIFQLDGEFAACFCVCVFCFFFMFFFLSHPSAEGHLFQAQSACLLWACLCWASANACSITSSHISGKGSKHTECCQCM